MRVLHVAETAKGGVGTYLNELVQQQRALGLASDAHVIVPAEHREQLRDVRDADVTTYARSGRDLASLARLRRLIKAILAERQPDVLHLHSSFAGLVGRTLVKGRHATVFQPHGWSFEIWPSGAKRRIFATIERALQNRAEQSIAVSEAERLQALAVGLDDARLKVVLNGIESELPIAEAAPWRDERRKILLIGRLDRQKGVDTLIDIAARHADAISVRIIGEAVAGAQSDYPVPGNVEFMGWMDRRNITGQLLACDLLAMPSRWEAFGLTAIEAMRCGKPVVAFGVGGLPEVVANGITGILVAAEDSAAFSHAMIDTDLETLQRMGDAGRLRFSSVFTSDRMAHEIARVYQAAMENRSR